MKYQLTGRGGEIKTSSDSGGDEVPKVLRMEEDVFIERSANVTREAIREYREELEHSGNYSSDEIERMTHERQQEILEEMVSDYIGEGEETSETETPTHDGVEKSFFGFGRREIQETNEEVKQRMEQCGVHEVNLEGVKEEYQEMIAQNLEEMCESYPELQGYIYSIRATDLREGVFACAGPNMGKDGYCSEILVNRKIFSEAGLERRVAKLETPNWREETWLAGHGPDAVLKHEMAHILHLRMLAQEEGLEIGSHDKKAYEAVIDKYARNAIVTKICYDTFQEQGIHPNDWARHISVYGSRDMGECFAEAISEYETREKPREFAVEVYNKYKRRVHEHDDFTT